MSIIDYKSQTVYLGVLGLCPILAKSTTVLCGLAMGCATFFVLLMTISSVSICRRYIPFDFRLPLILIISVTWVLVLDFSMQAYFYELRESLGIYIPLLAMNCFLLAQLEHTGLTRPPLGAITYALLIGLIMLVVIGAVGTLRELFGLGSLLRDSQAFLGEDYGIWFADNGAYTVINKAPGVLLVLGLLLGLIKYIRPSLFTSCPD
jgi:electron transport complex protein RnfE